jgi:hypothetical protein
MALDLNESLKDFYEKDPDIKAFFNLPELAGFRFLHSEIYF